MFANVFNLFVTTFKSIKAIGSIRNSTDPVLSLIDGITNASDFIILKHKPKEKEMEDNIIYFYGVSDKVFYLNKEINYNNPIQVNENDFRGFKDLKGVSVFQKIKDKIADKEKELDIFSKGAVYRLLFSKGKFVAGIKYAFHRHIEVPYKKFEDGFIAKHDLIYRAYKKISGAFYNLCTFAVSETGARALGLTVAVGLAVISGGTFMAVAAGVYAAGIAVSLVRQTISKVKLNRLKNEADLLERYALSYKEKLILSTKKNVYFKDNFPKEEIKKKAPLTGVQKWGISSFKYLTAFGLEIGAPVAAAAFAPISAVMHFTILVASAALSCGVGVYLKKIEDDKKIILKDVIRDAKDHAFIPDYKNLEELREYVKLEDNRVKALKKLEILSSDVNPNKEFIRILNNLDVDIPSPKSTLREYAGAFFEVVNPFDRTKEIKDSRDVSEPLKKLGDVVKMNDLHIEIIKEESIKILAAKVKVPKLSGIKQRNRSNLPNIISRNSQDIRH
jgi:hypothetical protein